MNKIFSTKLPNYFFIHNLIQHFEHMVNVFKEEIGFKFPDLKITSFKHDSPLICELELIERIMFYSFRIQLRHKTVKSKRTIILDVKFSGEIEVRILNDSSGQDLLHKFSLLIHLTTRISSGPEHTEPCFVCSQDNLEKILPLLVEFLESGKVSFNEKT